MRTRSRPRRRLLYCRRAGALQLGVVPLDAAKFDHRDDPGGHPGLGFQRLPEPPHTLEVDPATIGVDFEPGWVGKTLNISGRA